jgi:hypothetical protein
MLVAASLIHGVNGITCASKSRYSIRSTVQHLEQAQAGQTWGGAAGRQLMAEESAREGRAHG